MLRHLIEDVEAPAGSQCNSFHHVPNITFLEICEFINSTDSCRPDDGFVDYLSFIYCTWSSSSHPQLWPLLFCLVIIWLLFLLNGLSIVADDFLCPTLTAIHRQLGLSENLVGVTFVAFGNGAPDIFGALAALDGGRPEPGLAFGALFGAGIFVTTVVVGAIALIKPFHPMERPLLRDVIFYIITVAWSYSLLYRSRVEIFDAVGFIVLYAIYAIVVVVGRRLNLFLRARNEDTVNDKGANVAAPNQPTAGLPENFDDLPVVSVLGADDLSLRLNIDNKDDLLLNPSFSSGDDEDDVILRHPEGPNRPDSDILVSSCARTAIGSVQSGSVNTAAQEVDLDLDLTSSSTLDWDQLGFPVSAWKEASAAGKCYHLFSTPLRFVFAVTVPLAEFDDFTRTLTGWNQLMYGGHFFVIPVFVISALGFGAVSVAPCSPITLAILAVIFGFMAACLLYTVTNAEETPRLFRLAPYLGFFVSVLWIYTLADEIVGILHAVGIVADIDAAVLGLTVLAWGNSIGDLITDCALAKAGNSRMALTACFAAPLFNTLLGFGIPFTISIVQAHHSFSFPRTDINAILILALGAALLFTLLWMVSTHFAVGRIYGCVLIILYVAFLLISSLDLFDVIHFKFAVIIGG